MPFVEFDVEKYIQEQCEKSPEFKKAWEEGQARHEAEAEFFKRMNEKRPESERIQFVETQEDVEDLITMGDDAEDDFDEDDDYNVYYDETCRECDSMKFIFGRKSYHDLSGADACLETMNDIEVIYFKDKKYYAVDIETAYMFKNHEAECQYLKWCLDVFTQYMDENGLNKNEPPMLFMSQPCIGNHANTIEELYTQFKMFVNGYCSLDITGDYYKD